MPSVLGNLGMLDKFKSGRASKYDVSRLGLHTSTHFSDNAFLHIAPHQAGMFEGILSVIIFMDGQEA